MRRFDAVTRHLCRILFKRRHSCRTTRKEKVERKNKMAKKRKRHKKSKKTSQIKWQFEPDVPTNDVLKYINSEKLYGYEIALSDLIHDIGSGYYLLWEAVISQEQNLPLTSSHKKTLNDLMYFGHEDKSRTLYIDEIPRPKEPWYEVVRKIIPNIIEEPLRTIEGGSEAVFEGWPMFKEVLEEHGQHLSLPSDAQKAIDIIPLKSRHLLELHLCFDALTGLGQEEELTLENPEQREYRIEWFLRCIKEHKESIQFFDLSLETLLTKIIMPSKDEKVFIRLMTKELNLPSPQASLAEFL